MSKCHGGNCCCEHHEHEEHSCSCGCHHHEDKRMIYLRLAGGVIITLIMLFFRVPSYAKAYLQIKEKGI